MRYHAAVVTEADKLTGLDAGTVLRGRYRLLHSTSAGGGTVRAFDRLRQQNVAVRLYGPNVDEAVRERVRAGAARAVAVVSPAVAPLFSFDEQGEWALAVRAWVEGDPLTVTLAQRGPLAPRAFLQVATSLLDGLVALEAAGLAHGAVSARNVIMTVSDASDDVEALLVDAGIALPSPGQASVASDLAQLGALLALALGFGERFDARAARLQLRNGAGVVDVLERLIAGRPAGFSSAAEARTAVIEAVACWVFGRSVVAAPPLPTAPPAEEAAAPAGPPASPARVEPESSVVRREIRITGDPIGARVRWNGRDAGVTPLVIVDRTGGAHSLEIEAEGFLPQRLTVEAGGDVTMQYALAPAPASEAMVAVSGSALAPEHLAVFVPEKAPPRRRWWRRWQPWVGFGAGGAAMAIGTFLGATPLQLLGLTAALGAVGAILAG